MWYGKNGSDVDEWLHGLTVCIYHLPLMVMMILLSSGGLSSCNQFLSVQEEQNSALD